ncbi:hypothetical protein [Chamaesiphon minutus]|uniref:Uncharacterized protein n=1 Tax=Chamaesiphon minutus (strain ATCC 27169 / PCC 6605) TaxID=1173020 RepID=K9UMV1_CHAP6|nr:hypothetical protein [Chamaesiphon minutus]AFY95993.1 hypothetical protein Cha6605_5092 [Chamaesiphon minutus PCC 6605]
MRTARSKVNHNFKVFRYSHEVRYLQIDGNTFDSVAIAGNEFVVIYDLDIGMSLDEYVDIMAVGNICLDSAHFGNFNVTIYSLFLKKITVIFEVQRWYSHAGAKLRQQMGLGELVVTTQLAYTQIATKLVNDDEFEMEIPSRIDRIDLEQLIFNSDCDTCFQ